MRTTEYVIFSLTLILTGYLIRGCSSLPLLGQPQQKKPNHITGFTSGNLSYDVATFNNFDDAISDLAEVEFADSNGTITNDTRENEIRYILEREVDTTGDASSWMFAVHHANTTSVAIYNHNERSIVTRHAGFSCPVISIDQIISPRQLIDHNMAMIFGDESTNELVSQEEALEDGNYMLTQVRAGRVTNPDIQCNYWSADCDP
jgi:hypothetical protein